MEDPIMFKHYPRGVPLPVKPEQETLPEWAWEPSFLTVRDDLVEARSDYRGVEGHMWGNVTLTVLAQYSGVVLGTIRIQGSWKDDDSNLYIHLE